MNKKTKSKLLNYGLLLFFLSSTYLLLEVLTAAFLPNMPLRLQGYLPRAIGILAQSSKNGLKPKIYVALCGDSNAVGLGEWFKSVNKWKNPDFGSQHILHKKTGSDVITFGQSGVGSLGGMVASPINGFRYLDSTSFFRIDKPEIILAYFFEGNDINNNIEEIELRFREKEKYDMKKLYDKAYFRKFIKEVIIDKDRAYAEEIKSFRWYDNLVFLKFMRNMISSDLEKIMGKRMKNIEGDEENPGKVKDRKWDLAEEQINRVLVNGKEVAVPGRLQSPALELNEKEIELSLYVFEQSLDYMRQFFNGSKIFVVYIPSPLSSYDLASDKVSIQTYHGRDTIYKAGDVAKNNYLISSRIKKIAEDNDCVFINTTEAIRNASRKKLLHGPKEWKHFNKDGYTAFTEAIIPYMSLNVSKDAGLKR